VERDDFPLRSSFPGNYRAPGRRSVRARVRRQGRGRHIDSRVLVDDLLLAEKRDAFLAAIGPGAYNKEVNQKVSSDLPRFDLNPEIRKFHFPTLVITGRYDMNVAPLVAYRIHKQIPGSRFLVFEKSSHLPFTEEPEAFTRAMEEFLQTNENCAWSTRFVRVGLLRHDDEVVEVIALGWSLFAKDVHGVEACGAHRRQ